MTTPKTIQLVARLSPPVSSITDALENDGNGCRSFVISRLKPVVIEPPRPSSQNQIVLLDSDDASDYESVISTFDGTSPPKRARLTNLTSEEKILRRKLKNRVSAQTARDRKKQRMQELEEAIAILQQRNKILEAENFSLKSKTETLMKENKDLKQQLLGSPSLNLDASKGTIIIESPKPQIIHVQKKRKMDSEASVAVLPKPILPSNIAKIVIKKSSSASESERSGVTSSILEKSSEQSCGPAALTWLPPLQQELLCLMVVQLLVLVSFINWTSLGIALSMNSSETRKESEVMISNKISKVIMEKRKKPVWRLRKWEKKPTLKRWWGRHQRNWNPSANSSGSPT